MKTKVKVVGPKVHNVGYRPFLIALADEFAIQKFEVFNSVAEDKQLVIAKIDADDDQFQAFMEAVRSRKPKKAEVSDIVIEPFEGRVRSIVRTSMMSMNTQLAKGIDAIEDMNGKMDQMLEKQDKMLEKQDKMLEKQDKMLEKQDKMLEKQDKMLEKQDQTIFTLVGMDGKMDQMLERQVETTEAVRDLKHSDERFSRMEKDIRTIKIKLGIR